MHVKTALLEPRDDRPRPINLVVRDNIERTSAQIRLLLDVSGLCSNFLISHPDTGTQTEIDDTAKQEARKTFESAQLQLRNILDDMSRWDSGIDQLAGQLQTAVEAEQRRAEAQTKAAETSELPSSRLHPTIGIDTENGEWVAMNGAFFGRGKTPADAIRDFDQRFFTATNATPEPAPAASKSSKPRKKK